MAVSTFLSSPKHFFFPFSTEEFLNLDNNMQLYSGTSDEDILAEFSSVDQSDKEEATDCSQDKTQILSKNAILLMKGFLLLIQMKIHLHEH